MGQNKSSFNGGFEILDEDVVSNTRSATGDSEMHTDSELAERPWAPALQTSREIRNVPSPAAEKLMDTGVNIGSIAAIRTTNVTALITSHSLRKRLLRSSSNFS